MQFFTKAKNHSQVPKSISYHIILVNVFVAAAAAAAGNFAFHSNIDCHSTAFFF